MRGLWPARRGFVSKSVLEPKAGIWTLETARQKTVASGKTFIQNGEVNQFRNQEHSDPASVHFKGLGLEWKLGENDHANEQRC